MLLPNFTLQYIRNPQGKYNKKIRPTKSKKKTNPTPRRALIVVFNNDQYKESTTQQDASKRRKIMQSSKADTYDNYMSIQKGFPFKKSFNFILPPVCIARFPKFFFVIKT